MLVLVLMSVATHHGELENSIESNQDRNRSGLSDSRLLLDDSSEIERETFKLLEYKYSQIVAEKKNN